MAITICCDSLIQFQQLKVNDIRHIMSNRQQNLPCVSLIPIIVSKPIFHHQLKSIINFAASLPLNP